MSMYPFNPQWPTIEGLVTKLGAEPAWVALATLVLLPMALCSWCWQNRTLRIRPDVGNPNGHGLFSWINIYLILTIPLNYAIFSYYAAYTAVVARLQAQGILSAEAIGQLPFTDASYSAYATTVAYTTAFVLALASFLWTSVIRPNRITNWLTRRGKPRLVSAYFHFVFFALELAVIFNWVLHHCLIWRAMNRVLELATLEPFDPDRMFGLHPLSTFVWWSFIVITMIAILVAVWLVGSALTMRAEPFFANPGHSASIVSLFIFVPIDLTPENCSKNYVGPQPSEDQCGRVDSRKNRSFRSCRSGTRARSWPTWCGAMA